ncbi:MAG: SHD1 domain-containing protein [Planctomycetaceae bacterium]
MPHPIRRPRRVVAMLLLGAFAAAVPSVHAGETRTWTDKTGKFRIEAEFVGEEDGVVTLRKEDGDEIEVPLDKLSSADKRAVSEAKAAAEDNPFASKAKEKDPFASKKKPAADSGKGRAKGGTATAKKRAPADDDDGDAPAKPAEVTVDWSAAELVASGTEGEWTIEVGAAPESVAKPRPVAIPGKSNFFEAMVPLAVSGDGSKVAIGYLLGEPKPDGTCRVVVADLASGKATPVAVTTGQVAPFALHDDGAHMLARREEFGFGNHDRLEVWKVAGGKVRKLRSFIPYPQAGGASRDIGWARFLDGESFATAGNGELAVWRFPELEPVCRLPVSGVPALSPDRRFIAFCDAGGVGLFDVEAREVVARRAVPAGLFNPQLAFSPSGQRLACIARQTLLVWDVAAGDVIREMEVPSIPIFTGIAFPDEDWVLGGNQYLIGVESGILLWTYSGQQQVTTAGPWTLFGTVDGEKSGALVPLAIPHPAAKALLAKAAADPNLFVLREGTRVRIDVERIPDPTARAQAAEALAERLRTIGCPADPAGSIVLSASVSGPEKKTLSLRNAGDYDVQEWVTALEFVHEGKPVWRTQSSNVPGGPVVFFNLEEGENIGSWLAKRQKPDYGLFERVELPRFLQRPTAGGAAGGSPTLGTSQVTTAGLR